MLKSLIFKAKTLKLLILTLFLSSIKEISLALTLLFSGLLLDNLSTKGELFNLNFILVISFLLNYSFLSFLSTFLEVIFRSKLRQSLRKSIFNFVISSPSPLEISAQKSVGYLREVEEKIFLGINSLTNFLNGFLAIIIHLIVMNIYNFTVALIALPLIILFIVMPLIGRNFEAKWGRKLTEIVQMRSTKFLNLISGYSVLAIFKQKEILPQLYKDKLKILDKEFVKNHAKLLTIMHLFNVPFFAFYAIINIIIGYFVVTQAIGYGAFLVVNSLARQLINRGGIAINQLQEFLRIRGIAQDMTPQKREIKEIGAFKNITIKDLIFHHKNNEEPLYNHLNLKFEEGKKYALIGPSGCGKSTLALILLKIFDTPEKSLFWSGIDYENLHFEDITQETNFVSGNFTIFQGSLRENLTLENNNEDSKILEVVDLLGLNDIPLDRQIDKDSISTGQRQRILVGRALLRNCRLLILDEALANVDPTNAKRILKKLLSDKELTLIHITHHLKSNDNYDQIIELGVKNG